MSLEVGSKAPEFTLPAHDGQNIGIADLLGKNVVIYFYPKDNTPGCTIEAIDFSKLIESFKAHNTCVLGISADSIKSHCSFVEKKDLKVILLSDQDATVAKLYNVWKEKRLFLKKYMGIERSTFLIDDKGIITKIWKDVRASGHADEVLSYVINMR